MKIAAIIFTLILMLAAYSPAEGKADFDESLYLDSDKYWKEHSSEIKEVYNPYIKSFVHEGVDFRELRSLLGEDVEFDLIGSLGMENSGNFRLKVLDEEAKGSFARLYFLHEFVSSIDYEAVEGTASAKYTLLSGKGDCSEKSVLLYALLSSNGIQSYISDGKNHRFLFVNIDGIWMPIDPTSSDLFYAQKNWHLEIYHSAMPFILNKEKTLFNADLYDH